MALVHGEECRGPERGRAQAVRLEFAGEFAVDVPREQYERQIGSFQALKHRFADAYLSVERAASLSYFASLTVAEDDERRAQAASLTGDTDAISVKTRMPIGKDHVLGFGDIVEIMATK